MRMTTRKIIRCAKKIEIPWFAILTVAIFIFSLLCGGQIESLMYKLARSHIVDEQFYQNMLYLEFPVLKIINNSVNNQTIDTSLSDQAAEISDTKSDMAEIDEPNADFEMLSQYNNLSHLTADSADNIKYSYETTASPNDILNLLAAKPIAALTISPTNPSGYIEHNGIYIKNSTSYDIDIQASLDKKLDFELSADSPHVLIIHTHGSESYSSDGKNYYTSDDIDRNTDENKNVIAVGNTLTDILNSNGIGTVHITDFFDYPEYNGAYNRALQAITQQMKKTPSIKMVIDIHRDAMVSTNGTKYKTVTKINGKDAAQIMFVCGTNEGGLPHSGWAKNLRLMIRLQDTMNKKYSNLMRPIDLRAERFNQHVTTGSMLVEIGTSGNTLDEAIYSAQLFGETLSEFLKEYID